MTRTNLKIMRVKNGLTQEKFADKVNVTRVTYANVENGLRSGSFAFWQSVQNNFNIPDAEMWELMKNDAE